jgi:hypothetical protein
MAMSNTFYPDGNIYLRDGEFRSKETGEVVKTTFGDPDMIALTKKYSLLAEQYLLGTYRARIGDDGIEGEDELLNVTYGITCLCGREVHRIETVERYADARLNLPLKCLCNRHYSTKPDPESEFKVIVQLIDGPEA